MPLRIFTLSLLLLLPSLAHAKPPKPTRFVLAICDDCPRLSIGAYVTAGIDAATAAEASTPSIDTMATNGVRVDGFVAGANCSPSRMTLYGLGESHRPTHRHGNVIEGYPDVDWPTTVTINPNDPNILFRRAEAHGFETFFAGKFHIYPDRIYKGLPDIATTLGIDRMPSGMQNNPQHPMTLLDNGTANEVLTAEVGNLGHSCWAKFVGSTVTLETEYNNKQFFDAAITDLAADGATGSQFYVISGSAPHSPSSADASPTCPSSGSDDRPPGDTTSSAGVQTFVSGIEYFDTKLGELRTTLDDGVSNRLNPTTGDTILCVVGDNGIPSFASPAQVPGGRWKATPYPAGVQVPLVCEGRGIAAGSVIPADVALGMADLNKTIDAILGQTNGGGHRDGQSFADCFDSNSAATNCVGPDYVLIERFAPVGGDVDGTHQYPPRIGDAANLWTDVWQLCVSGDIWVNRQVNEGVTRGAATFFEEIFDTNTVANQYFASGDEEATTGPAPTYGGALTAGTLTATQNTARILCQSAFDQTLLRNGAPGYALGGGVNR